MQVSELMTREVITVKPETPIKAVIELMQAHNISGLPVVEEGFAIGMISKSDLVFREKHLHLPAYVFFFDSIIYLENPKQLEQDIQKAVGLEACDVMTTPPIAINLDADESDAATLMLEHGVNRLPVVDDGGYLIGILTRADLMRSLAAEQTT